MTASPAEGTGGSASPVRRRFSRTQAGASLAGNCWGRPGFVCLACCRSTWRAVWWPPCKLVLDGMAGGTALPPPTWDAPLQWLWGMAQLMACTSSHEALPVVPGAHHALSARVGLAPGVLRW